MNGKLRDFLWFQRGSDGSLYIGTAIGKTFTFGQKGVLHAYKDDIGGTPLNIDNGKAVVQKEISGKYSYHKSGIINLPTLSSGKTDRLGMNVLSKHDGILPLISVLPMNPAKYPESMKRRKDNDLVIDCNINEGRCIGVVVFAVLGKKNLAPFELLKKLRAEGFSIIVTKTDIGNITLCAITYFKVGFLGWPSEQIDAIAHPDNSRNLPWTILVPNYKT